MVGLQVGGWQWRRSRCTGESARVPLRGRAGGGVKKELWVWGSRHVHARAQVKGLPTTKSSSSSSSSSSSLTGVMRWNQQCCEASRLVLDQGLLSHQQQQPETEQPQTTMHSSTQSDFNERCGLQ